MKHVSGRRFAQILVGKGWTHVRTTGSHKVYRSPNGATTVPVPIHGNEDLATGTQRALMRQASIRSEDL